MWINVSMMYIQARSYILVGLARPKLLAVALTHLIKKFTCTF